MATNIESHFVLCNTRSLLLIYRLDILQAGENQLNLNRVVQFHK